MAAWARVAPLALSCHPNALPCHIEKPRRRCYLDPQPGRSGAPSAGGNALAYGELTAGTSAGPDTPRPGTASGDGQPAVLTAILASLEDDKAEDIVTIDLRGRSSMCDAMVVATGRSSRQVAAISEKLVERLKTGHAITARTEGRDTGDWVLIDAGDVVVHVFRPEVRDFYQIEKMWQTAGG